MIGEIITAGASLLGSLFGGGDETTTSQINYKDMVKDAEAAGFNPLTAIRNGGSAGYTQTSHPGLSSGAFIADAIGKIGNVIASHDPMAEQTAKLEYQIRQETLRNLQADTAARLRASIGGVPVSAGATVVRQAGGLSPKPAPIPDLYTPWRDNSVEGGGRVIYLPNADLPEGEQMLVPTLGIVGNEAVQAGRYLGFGGPPVTPAKPRPAGANAGRSWRPVISRPPSRGRPLY
ncbi:MAG: hypothetical protein E5X86_12615 [Mesorhizobium sp.]|uniref:hypothetical protein n=1 Tax=Mesorhizobium sp. TaxID=1871066 RepID=UPI000FE9A619|nr:hypothetical protein [Mesorhizobium sp.]RWM79350.1 MAG: hypothetical protein EOR83_29605 [Mesorhizobium sp.]TIO17254.1 MAG: hypothetical protein E5X86_12615 [Mesorhizobium sp.]